MIIWVIGVLKRTVFWRLTFLQPYLRSLSPHTSSQPITSRVYQRLLYASVTRIFEFNCHLTRKIASAQIVANNRPSQDSNFQSWFVSPCFKPFSYRGLVVRIYLCIIYVGMYVCVYVCMYVSIYLSIYLSISLSLYIYIYLVFTKSVDSNFRAF